MTDMPSDIRKERAFDGRCTIFAGSGLIISNLSDETADVLVARLTGESPTISEPRTSGGRGFAAASKTQRSARTSGRRAV